MIMQIFINDKPVECLPKSTISSLLEQQNIQPSYLAVALNETVIPKTEWQQTEIPAGSRIIIIKAIQGG